MSRSIRFSSVSVAAVMLPGIAAAQNVPPPAPVNTVAQAINPDIPPNDAETVVVTGVRGQARTVADSPVPIDVISPREIRSVSNTDTVDVLRTVIPSLNVTRAPNSTTGTFIRSVTLRGLPEDKTLLLVNSKRRHRTASVGISGAGAHGQDSAVIPSLALRSIEVLRDGAAAQYGSDAIAGVVNFILNDADHGVAATAQAGQYYKGDGESLMAAVNAGFKIGARGFLNVTAQFNDDQNTNRANQFTTTVFDARAYAAANPAYAALVDLDRPLQPSGQPKNRAIRTFVNSGYDVTDDVRVYAFGNYSWSRGLAFGNYRYPVAGQPVNDVPVRLQNGSIFRFNQLFPAGFTPHFTGTVQDMSSVGGVKGQVDLGGNALSYDVGMRYGWNKIVYRIFNTVNPSLGPASPREFTPNTYTNEELGVNGDFSYEVPVAAFAKPLTLSAGFEARKETYKIFPGDPASYAAGTFSRPDPFGFCNAATRTLNPTAPQNQGINCANYLAGTADGFAGIDPVYGTLSGGSNGFTGTQPTIAGSFRQRSQSVYAEVSTDVVTGVFLDVAGRYEHYDQFGSTVNGKAATRIELVRGVAVRGSIGTGFHAPSAGYLNQSYVSIQTINGIPTLAGLFPATSPVPQFLGATPLKPEKSTNFALGLTLNPMPGFSLTIDGYLIDIRDQLFSTSNIAVTPAIRAAMIAAGVLGGDSISSVNFFQNAFDSRTRGLDVVGTYRQRWSADQSTDFFASLNINRYKIRRLNIPNLFNQVSINNFQRQPPRYRSVVSVTHNIGAVSLLARANLFGSYRAQRDIAPAFPIQRFGAEALIDVEATYRFSEMVGLSIGARNVFDNYPDRDRIGAVTNGAVYRADSVVDWQGGFYYARINLNF
ncbi:MAG: TonB-dependent receptor [Sphingomonas fennica]